MLDDLHNESLWYTVMLYSKMIITFAEFINLIVLCFGGCS